MEKQILKEQLSKMLRNVDKTESENILKCAAKNLTKPVVKAYDNKK